MTNVSSSAQIGRIAVMAVFSLVAAVVFGDDGRWYDSAQRVSWGFTVLNGEATISTPGFWDSNARDNCTGDIVVPPRIGPDGPNGAKTYPVRDMAPGLFRNCTKVTSVVLPDGIRRIAPNAFYFDRNSIITNIVIGEGCLDICENAFLRCEKLVSLNIPNTVTNIGENAIQLCKVLPRIDIPSSVKVVGDSAFSACYALEAVTFGDGIEIIDADAFLNCSSLLAANLPASVRTIGDRAFYGCDALASATLREGLKTIGNYAFNQCSSLASVSIPSSVTYVGERAFQYCPDSIFDKETVPGVCLLSGWTVGVDNPFGAIDLFGVNGVADGLFKDCRNVTSVVLPPGIETLGGSMFSGCRSLETVSLPAALKSIESYAFQSCEKLQAVTIPSGVTNIGQQAFELCRELAAVALPDGLAAMGDNAFDGCTNLTSLTIPASLKRIPMGAFENCTSLTNVTIKEGVEVIGNASFYGCRALPSFTIPESVKTVENIAFGGCAFLDTNTIANVEMVDGWIVGSSQPNLTEVTIPGDVRGIADEAFSYRRNLTNVVVEVGVRRIPDHCFNCTPALADVTLPDTLEEICDFAFNNTSLVEAWVPSNVVAVGAYAFGGSKTLETVYLPISLKGKVDATSLIMESFDAEVRYYKPDGSIDDGKRVMFDPNGGELAETEASRDVKEGAAVGALPEPMRLRYKFLGWFTEKEWGDKVTVATKIEDDVTFYAHWEEDLGWLVLAIADEYETMADGSFELGLEGLVESASAPKFTVKGLPAGIKYDAKAMTISGKATKPGVYKVTVSATNAKRKSPVSAAFALVVPNLTCEALLGLDPATDAYGQVPCGVAFDAALVDCSPADGWTVKVSGLPAGMKYDAKTGVITGVPTKAVTNTVTFTASKKGEKNQIATITFVTAALPAWAQGTFAGYVKDGDDYGSATMTVAANGKASGKIALGGTNWTFSAASYAAVDDEVFVVEATAKAGKLTAPISLTVRREDGWRATLQNGIVSGTFGECDASLWRNMWKDRATSATAKVEIARWEGVYTISTDDGGYLSLTVGKDGTVKAAGKLADGTAISASCPFMYHICWDFFTFVWASPSAYKGGFVWLNEIRFGTERGSLAGSMVVRSRNPQTTGEYGEGVSRHLYFTGAYYDKTKKLNDYYETLLFATEAPDLGYVFKRTYIGDDNRKATAHESMVASADSAPFGQEGCVVGIGGKGQFVVMKATRPVHDKETKEWHYDGTNDGALTLSFAQATGIFKGSYTFWYDYASAYDETTGRETMAHVPKKVSFEGIMVQGRPSMTGFYLWDATGSYEDPKTGRPKTYKYKESHPVSLDSVDGD